MSEEPKTEKDVENDEYVIELMPATPETIRNNRIMFSLLLAPIIGTYISYLFWFLIIPIIKILSHGQFSILIKTIVTGITASITTATLTIKFAFPFMYIVTLCFILLVVIPFEKYNFRNIFAYIIAGPIICGIVSFLLFGLPSFLIFTKTIFIAPFCSLTVWFIMTYKRMD